MNHRIDRGSVTTPRGFTACGIRCGIKEQGKDLALIRSDVPAAVAALYTTNKIVAAPVILSREKSAAGTAQAVIVNSGNANACTGEQGRRDAREMVALVARHLGLEESQVLIASTGVIGRTLPMEKIRTGIAAAARALSSDGGVDAAEAIMTTDTRAKHFSVSFEIEGKPCTIGAICKGSGMINPHMATTINVLTTDVAITPNLLQEALRECVDVSLNALTVDGTMSTNDTIFLLANGLAENPHIAERGAAFETFLSALQAICIEMAKELARDGEGATKLITVTVEGAKNRQEAMRAAKEIANAALVKTAVYGKDPNWGRVAAAVGGCQVEVDPEALTIEFAGLAVAKNGGAISYDETAMRDALEKDHVPIKVRLGTGPAAATVFTCDLTHEYITINAEYTT